MCLPGGQVHLLSERNLTLKRLYFVEHCLARVFFQTDEFLKKRNHVEHKDLSLLNCNKYRKSLA